MRQRSTDRLDLETCLFDSALLKLAPDTFVWYLNQHHLITDNWSVSLLYRQLQDYYGQLLKGDLADLSALPGYLDYADLVKTVTVYSDGDLDLSIDRAAVNLQEVIVSGEAIDANVENVQIGVERLDAKEVKKTPTFMGEADVIKTLLLTPGVSSVGEAASGFNVRGGNVDQNLILQDEAFIFNSSHSLGILSTFNADLLRSVQLYKGNIPAPTQNERGGGSILKGNALHNHFFGKGFIKDLCSMNQMKLAATHGTIVGVTAVRSTL